MGRVLLSCCLLLALIFTAVNANTVDLHSSPSDLQFFDFATPKYLTFGVYVQPCSQQSCCGADNCVSTSSQPTSQCSGHAYCGTDTNNNCITGQDETATVSVLLGIEFACCYNGGDLTAQCGNTGGQVGGFVTDNLSPVTLTLPFKKCYNYPTTDATAKEAWQFVGQTDLNTLIRPLCPSNTNGWTLALSKSYARAYAAAAVADITWTGNNDVDVLYFYSHFGVTGDKSALVPAAVTQNFWEGPSSGIQGGATCAPTVNAPAPSVVPGAQVCTGSCGCYFINMLNKTASGTVYAPATTYTFQVCVLCKSGFSYLQLCNADGLPASIGGGVLCKYSLVNTTKNGCLTLKWATPSSCSTPFLNGACDILTVTIAGPSNGYVFQFEGHAGNGQTLFPVVIDTSTCTCGSDCFKTTTPSVTTTQGATTTQGPPPTDSNGSTLPTTTVDTTTAAPPPTDSNGSTLPTTTTVDTTTPAPTFNCPDEYAAGANCDCIYTLAGQDPQAWCKPDGSGSYIWKLVPLGEVPSNPASQGWVRPGTIDPKGYQLSCSCQKKIINCQVQCKGGSCICDTARGVCVDDPVCNIVTTAPPSGTVCPPSCPKDANGAECSNHGVCDGCGTCICASVDGLNYTGVACEDVAGCPQFDDCSSCRTAGAKYDCGWCNYGTGSKCLSSGACALVGREVDCSGGVVFVPADCPNNCSNHGLCTTSGNITQCVCKKGFHGADCSASGGLSAAAKAAAISGGVIAAIVICGVIAIVIISFGAKKAVDWAQLNNEASSKSHHNPMYHDTNVNNESRLYQNKD